jgi:hypothetical protein
MPKNEPVTYDHTETYEKVLMPLIEKIERVCRAFDIPYLILTQPKSEGEEAHVRGGTFTPPHAAAHFKLATTIAASRDRDHMDEIIMRGAAAIMMDSIRAEHTSGMKELFAGIKSEVDKPVN